jgi:hypothetical protein
MNKEQHKELNIMCTKAFGMSYNCMPDLTYVADLFDDGCSVSEVFNECLRNWEEDDPFFAMLFPEA